jgi:hypothetical protein
MQKGVHVILVSDVGFKMVKVLLIMSTYWRRSLKSIFRNLAKEVVLKICWFKHKVKWDDCLFPSVDVTQVFRVDCFLDQPFAFPKNVEQIVFAPNSLDLN